MEKETLSPYNFTIRDFEFCGTPCRVAITPELFSDEGNLDFTGSYTGILISAQTGTMSFSLFPEDDEGKEWEAEPNLNPKLISEFAKIIQEIRAGKAEQVSASFN